MTETSGATDRDTGPGWRWDVALSFAGAQRDYVEQVAQALKARGLRCFYDADEQIDLWGKYLAEELPTIYGEQAAAVVVFISAEYAERDWTRHERRAALARAVRERREYVLPARFDDTPLPGLLPDMVTVDLRTRTPQQFAAMVAGKLAALATTVPAPSAGTGRLLDEMTDPFLLEVHRPVQPEDAPPGLPVLPPYVPREHDRVLGQVVRAAAEGRSGIAVLVGGSSTGKTRACWEALALLRGQDPLWRLWHPIDPSRPDAALAELPGVGPRTVVWLNEAQFYLDPAEAGLGERVAAGLRALLRNPGRAPVLVLATVWPKFWHALTGRPADGNDRHAQARELLAGHDITVPAAFTPAQMSQLTQAADARMALAARSARDGEVIQFLAGAPELLARYRHAPPAAKALIEAAMEARRLGTGAGLPQAFLQAAAPGYLTDDQWDGLAEDWLEQALAYAADPCKGARGPLTRIRLRPARHAARHRGDQPASTAALAGPLYRLADYLDQHGRAHRAGQAPPPEFWSAAAAHAAPGDQAALGDAAHDRGLYRDAAQLHKNAAASGNLHAAIYLSHPPACLRADPRPAHWAAAHAHAPLDDPAAHVPLDEPYAVAWLLRSLREAGADEQAAALLARDPAAHAPLDNPAAVARLLRSLREAGADEQAAALLARDPAAHVHLDDPGRVASLLVSLREAGAREQAAALARRAAAHVSLDDPGAVTWLLDMLRFAGADEQAAALLARNPAAHVHLDDPSGVTSLLHRLREAGADEQAAALLARDPAAHVHLDDPSGVAWLLVMLRFAGADEQAAALLARNPAAHVHLDDPGGVARLARSLRGAGAREQAAALAGRMPAAGMFELFLEQNGPADQFRFGREADGIPAAPWGWEDLDLWLVPQSQGQAAPTQR
jgi:TIR domain